MFSKYYKCQNIQTVKILKCYFMDDKVTSALKDNVDYSNAILELELKMRDGSANYLKTEARLAFKKYEEFIDNHKDENFNHNINMIRQNNLLDLYDENIIPMHENPVSNDSKCIIS